MVPTLTRQLVRVAASLDKSEPGCLVFADGVLVNQLRRRGRLLTLLVSVVTLGTERMTVLSRRRSPSYLLGIPVLRGHALRCTARSRN